MKADLRVVGIAAAAVLWAVGCGGSTSKEGGGGAGDTGGGGGTASSSSSGAGGAAGQTASSSSSTSSSGGGSGPSLEKCKEKAQASSKPECALCACESCLDVLAACEADPGCVGLRTCALTNNCCDEICVISKCMDELAAAGGPSGEGTKKVIAVRDCTDKAGCNCCK
ncbi:MAG: hypothetical protein HY744_18845 [Deltaproteobacteria bacterium]|nr:hypothetical protein [Deltaproteobacteria bacterium]